MGRILLVFCALCVLVLGSVTARAEKITSDMTGYEKNITAYLALIDAAEKQGHPDTLLTKKAGAILGEIVVESDAFLGKSHRVDDFPHLMKQCGQVGRILHRFSFFMSGDIKLHTQDVQKRRRVIWNGIRRNSKMFKHQILILSPLEVRCQATLSGLLPKLVKHFNKIGIMTPTRRKGVKQASRGMLGVFVGALRMAMHTDDYVAGRRKLISVLAKHASTLASVMSVTVREKLATKMPLKAALAKKPFKLYLKKIAAALDNKQCNVVCQIASGK